MARDRHLFPGGNTPDGFNSYYQYILPQDKARHIFCIKGGPGVGKSTFMKKIGEAMGERGLAAEYLHCSSDPGSLDGLVLPELAVAFIDGTAPHVVDPKNPGAVDEIINLGQYWDLERVKEHRRDIMDDNAELGKRFARVYRYLGAAKRLYDDAAVLHDECTAQTAADNELEALLPLFEGRRLGSGLGRERRMFASAITPAGVVNYLDGLLSGYARVYAVEGAGTQPALFLRRVADEALRRGLDAEVFYCPMEPGLKPEHVLIPALSAAFTWVNRWHTALKPEYARIDFSQYIDSQALAKRSEALLFANEQFSLLLRKAVATLAGIKALHDHMETFYIPSMDFEAITKLREGVIQRILTL